MQKREQIDAKLIQQSIIAASNNIAQFSDYIDSLNVFPVPDGDTGNNMSLTMKSAANMALSVKDEDLTIESICKAISKGALIGARGNSGVILSQIIKGFTKHLSTLNVINICDLSEALNCGTEMAYKAVMKPKEGTMLTVSRAIANKAEEIFDYATLQDFLREIIIAGQEALDNTPNQLPVLKEAGVVDSGGQGLIIILEGIYKNLTGDIDLLNIKDDLYIDKSVEEKNVNDSFDIEFKYCTEFIIKLNNPEKINESTEELKIYLENIGNSLVVVGDEDIIKIHVHTNHPGLAFEKGLIFGDLINMKVDNMEEEHNETLINKKEEPAAPVFEKELGIIAVASGDGIEALFKDIGVDEIIPGGQTMNPSTEDIINVINNVSAKKICILPNNKNIIMAAKQAADIITDKEIIVVPSSSIVEGIDFLLLTEISKSNDILSDFEKSIKQIVSIEITNATRDVCLDGMDIKQGHYIGITKDGIISCNKKLKMNVIQSIEKYIDDNTSLVTLYSGNKIDKATNDSIIETLEEKYPMIDFEAYEGGQPIYHYYISIE